MRVPLNSDTGLRLESEPLFYVFEFCFESLFDFKTLCVDSLILEVFNGEGRSSGSRVGSRDVQRVVGPSGLQVRPFIRRTFNGLSLQWVGLLKGQLLLYMEWAFHGPYTGWSFTLRG